MLSPSGTPNSSPKSPPQPKRCKADGFTCPNPADGEAGYCHNHTQQIGGKLRRGGVYYSRPLAHPMPTPDQLIDKVAAYFQVPREYITAASLHLIANYHSELHIPKHAARWLMTRVLGMTKREIMRVTGYSTNNKSSANKSFRFVEQRPRLMAALRELCAAEGWTILDDQVAPLRQQQMILAITNAVVTALRRPLEAQGIVTGRGSNNDVAHLVRWLAFHTMRLTVSRLAELFGGSRAAIHYHMGEAKKVPELIRVGERIARANHWPLFRRNTDKFRAGEYIWVDYLLEGEYELSRAQTLSYAPEQMHPVVRETLLTLAGCWGVRPEELVRPLAGCQDKELVGRAAIIGYICYRRGVRLSDVGTSLGGRTISAAHNWVKMVRRQTDLEAEAVRLAARHAWQLVRKHGK